MHNTYLIDSENTGDCWIELMAKDKESEYLVFYTGHSPRIDYEHAKLLMDAETKPEFIRCSEGNNALDFQLVTYLGYLLQSDNKKELTIVSNDTGFDSVVKFWTERGHEVKRINTIYLQKQDAPRIPLPVSPIRHSLLSEALIKESPSLKNTYTKSVPEELKYSEKFYMKDVDETNTTPKENDILGLDEDRFPDWYHTPETTNYLNPQPVKNEEKLYGVEKSELYAIAECFGYTDMNCIFLAYSHFYKNGTEIYKYVKSNGFEQKPLKMKHRKERLKFLCNMIFKYCNIYNASFPEGLCEFIDKNVVKGTSSSGFKTRLLQKYGQADGNTLLVYTILKPFIKSMTRV